MILTKGRAPHPHNTIPPRGLGAGVDFPVGRGEEADAVRHAREEQQVGATGAI